MQNNAYAIFVFFFNSFIEIQLIQKNEHIQYVPFEESELMLMLSHFSHVQLCATP